MTFEFYGMAYGHSLVTRTDSHGPGMGHWACDPRMLTFELNHDHTDLAYSKSREDPPRSNLPERLRLNL